VSSPERVLPGSGALGDRASGFRAPRTAVALTVAAQRWGVTREGFTRVWVELDCGPVSG
jgi:hypothetical protein